MNNQMKIVVAADSFKESLTSLRVAEAAEKGIRKVMPECEVVKFSVSDGGEGITGSIAGSLGGEYVETTVKDPLGRVVNASYALCGGTAVMEMASASGLPLVSPEERNPMLTSTFGTGEMILDAVERGCRDFLIGIGGSATCDGGTGMLEALGWKFLDAGGNELCGCGRNLPEIAFIDDTAVPEKIRESRFIVACDVRNPFCGPNGASFVFSPQKGAGPREVEYLDRGLEHFAGIIRTKYGIDITGMEGAGAAGGLGGAFKAFLGASLRRGIDIVLDAVDIDTAIADADLVITGEGRIDSQTPSGKTAAGVLERCRKFGVPCVAVGGSVAMCSELQNAGFAGIFPIAPGPCTLENAMKETVAFDNVSRTVSQIVTLFNSARK